MRGRGKLFYPKQYLVDFSTYIANGNVMDVALESEVHADHTVGRTEIDPAYGYNWDFSKLLYLPARIRVFVARVRGETRRTQLWEDLGGILAAGDGFLLRNPIVVFVLPPEWKGEIRVGCWDSSCWTRASLGTWREQK